MANHKSAKKRARQTVERAARNRGVKTRVKNSVRAFREAIASGDKSKAEVELKNATRTMRKAASAGVMHKVTTSRRVSRMMQAFNKA